MTARRQSSTTSLSQYAHDQYLNHQGEPEPSSYDFCNAFWGAGDAGVDVIFARMRGATRTVEELKIFFKERALIEEDYAKRMAKLSKQHLGRDEIGEMRACLESLKTETDKQAGFHQLLAQQIRTDMESVVNEFHSKQHNFKKTTQTTIERQYKAKQVQETYVAKAKEKYELDCQRINSYTAQSTLVQGRELEKIQLKLQRAEQTVQANERDFASFTRALGETTAKWEMDWKTFCDKSQDMEEMRMDFLKDVMWAYANSVSTVCVSDDESCERMRLSLEQLETPRDMENFVNRYGTGALIPYPPQFVSYDTTDGQASSSRLPPDRTAQFVRVSNRPRPEPLDDYPQQQQPEAELQDFDENMAGRGATGRTMPGVSPEPVEEPPAAPSPASSNRRPTSQINGQLNGITPAQATAASARAKAAASPAPIPSPTKPTAPTAGPSNPTTELKIGNNSYPVDPNLDPQDRRSPAPASRKGGLPGNDPLVSQMENLMNSRAGPSSGSNALSPPGGSPFAGHHQQQHDYRGTAEDVVGGVLPRSRPVSPAAQPSAIMMRPLSANGNRDGVPGSGSSIVNQYEQKFPGERRLSSAGAPSPGGSARQPSNGNGQISGLNRPPSQMGYAGIGAGSRPSSPQPGQSPQHYQQQPPPQQQQHRPTQSGGFMSPPSGSVPPRAVTPNSVGISLGASGKVMIDDFPSHQQPPRGVSPGIPHHANTGRRGSFIGSSPVGSINGHPAPQHSPNTSTGRVPAPAHNVPPWGRGTSPAPPQQQPMYNPNGYAGGAPVQAGYPGHQQHPSQGHPSQGHQQHPSQGHQQHPSQGQQHPSQGQPYGHGHSPSYSSGNPGQQMVLSTQATGYADPRYTQQVPVPTGQPSQQNGALVRGSSVTGGGAYYGAPPGPQQPPYGGHPGQQRSQHYPQQGHVIPQQVPGRGQYGRTPSPQPPTAPTGQATEDGMGILFYVKALYEYHASTDQEFDFQAGDIIAVTETPEDGWWTGELLDEARRQRGRNVFPSNFVCLLE